MDAVCVLLQQLFSLVVSAQRSGLFLKPFTSRLTDGTEQFKDQASFIIQPFLAKGFASLDVCERSKFTRLPDGLELPNGVVGSHAAKARHALTQQESPWCVIALLQPFQKPVKATFLRSADPFLGDVLDQSVFLAVLAEPTVVSRFLLAI